MVSAEEEPCWVVEQSSSEPLDKVGMPMQRLMTEGVDQKVVGMHDEPASEKEEDLEVGHRCELEEE